MEEDNAQRHGGIPSPMASLRILAREKAFVLVFVGSAVAMSLILTYVASEKFEAGTTIFYRPQSVWSTRPSKAESFGSPMPTPPFKVIGRTLQEIARSNAVLGPVVLELGLHIDPPKDYAGLPWYSRFYRQTKDFVKEYGHRGWMYLKHGRIPAEDAFQNAVKELRGNIRIVNEDSYVFILIARDKNPERAGRIVEGVANGLVQWLHNQEQNPGETRRARLDELLAEKNHEISRYRGEIEELLLRNDIASVDDEQARALERWSELELERVKVGSQIEQLRAEIAGIDAKLATEKLPASRTERLRAEDYHNLRSAKTTAEIDLAGHEASHASLKVSVAALRDRLQELPAVATAQRRLEFKIQEIERDVLGLRDAYQEAAVRATGQQSEAHVIHRPVVPTAPVAPIKIYHVGLSLLLSLSLAVGLVYLLAFLNVRILFTSLGPKGRRKDASRQSPIQGGPNTARAAGDRSTH